MKKYSVVGFFAREHGLNGLRELISSERYVPLYVFTHRRNPRSEDPDRKVRSDFVLFETLCGQNNIPLYSVDSSSEAKVADGILKEADFDFMVSISWRRLVPPDHLVLPRYRGINLHRGKLPEYAGAEPIKRALINNEKEIVITSHVLVEEIDAGEQIATYTHPTNYDSSESLEWNVARLKNELTPHFGPLMLNSLDRVVACEKK